MNEEDDEPGGKARISVWRRASRPMTTVARRPAGVELRSCDVELQRSIRGGRRFRGRGVARGRDCLCGGLEVRSTVTDLHLVVGLFTVGVNAIAALLGIAVIVRRQPSSAFLSLARFAQAVTVTQVVLGVLVLTGAEDRLPSGGHLTAAAAAIVALIVAESVGRFVARRFRDRDGAPEAVMALDSSAATAVRLPSVTEVAVLTGGLLFVASFAVLAVSTGWQ